MASGTVNQMKSDDFHHFCSLCMEPYGGRIVPKLLPCYHTFCLPCLITLERKASEMVEGEDGEEKNEDTEAKDSVDSEDETQEWAGELREEKSKRSEDVCEQESENDAIEERKQKRYTLFCPTCRASITIPPGGVPALQTNFYVTIDMDTRIDPAGKGPVLCEMCEDSQQEEAQHFCHHCHQRMCHSCRRLHDRVVGARDHQVESLYDKPAPQGETTSKGKKRCHFHPDQILCFHCCKCDVTICLHCKLTSHEGHDTQDMATAAIQAKGELTSLQIQGSKQLQMLETCISRLERDELDVKRQKQEIIQQLNSRYELLIGWATRARDEFLDELAAKEQISLNEIHAKKTSASFHKGNISSKKMHASQTAGLGADIVLRKNELQAALLKEQSCEDFHQLAVRREHLMFFTCSAETSVLELATLRAYIGELRDFPADATDCPFPSFPELALTVAKMETELKNMKDKIKMSVTKASFHATMTVNFNCSAYNNVVFNNVLFNEGNGYNSGNGIFTSPEEGTYMFSTTVRGSTNGYAYNVGLMVNDVEWGRTLPPESSSAHCVVKLKEGDQVVVRSYSNFACSASCSLFSGAMISM